MQLALLADAANAVYPANCALFSVVLVVPAALLVEFSGGSPVGALIDRIVDTAVGAAIVLGAFTLWPTREAPQTHALGGVRRSRRPLARREPERILGESDRWLLRPT